MVAQRWGRFASHDDRGCAAPATTRLVCVRRQWNRFSWPPDSPQTTLFDRKQTRRFHANRSWPDGERKVEAVVSVAVGPFLPGEDRELAVPVSQPIRVDCGLALKPALVVGVEDRPVCPLARGRCRSDAHVVDDRIGVVSSVEEDFASLRGNRWDLRRVPRPVGVAPIVIVV